MQKFDRLCEKYNKSKLEICLEFVFGQTWIDKIVLGINSTQQLQMIIDVVKRKEVQLECKSLAIEDLQLINPQIGPKHEDCCNNPSPFGIFTISI